MDGNSDPERAWLRENPLKVVCVWWWWGSVFLSGPLKSHHVELISLSHYYS